MSQARVISDGILTGEIEKGLVVYLGVESSDSSDDIDWLSRKITSMRIFGDEDGKMNLSVQDIGGGILIISQFTLYASTKKGNRPSFIRSANPEYAKQMYEQFIRTMDHSFSGVIATGVFAADMKVDYINDGPVTIIIDSQNRE